MILPRYARKTSAAFAGALLLGGLTLAAPAQQPPQRPQRVHANTDGFDVAPKAGTSANQVAGASRGIGAVQIYAPNEGKSYTLRPTLAWAESDPHTQYTFRVAPANDPEAYLVTRKVTGGFYIYPADAPALEPGKLYVFSVQPDTDIMDSPSSANVLIVGGKEREEIAADLARVAKFPDPELESARLFTEKRLWFDAVDAYNRLIAQNPGRKDLYRARAEIYSQLPQTQTLAEADKAHQ